MAVSESERAASFIHAKVEQDLAAGRYGGAVRTRFPPEPNGYLHIGHAKSICLNFGLAQRYGGTCNLRYDDTNPSTEDQEYVDAILRDLRWLGFEPDRILYASDYYGQLYGWAEALVLAGKAYVDDQNLDELREARGSVREAGTASVGRDRSPEANLALLREMRDGKHADGSMVLRAKIDLGHANMKLRDPLMYRIRRHSHYRTGDAWCVYPMYDWAHGQSDAIEGITHSICTLEFENNRELYDWFLAAIGPEALGVADVPNQYEFARLDLTWTVMSKRKLLKLVQGGYVGGWDDPRMPTIAGMRRRGVRPEAIRAFAETIGVARAQSKVDVGVLEHAIRDDLNAVAPRRMGVLDPLKVTIVNWQGGERTLVAASFPPDVGGEGERVIPMGPELFIDREDFAEAPPPGFFRLRPGGEVRLRYGCVIRCDEVVRDGDRVVELRCTADHDTFGAAPVGRSVKGTIHWVPARGAVPATLRLYDRLMKTADPEAEGDFLAALNPDSLVVVNGLVEPAVADDAPGVRYQLERHGYFYRAPEDAADGLVLSRIVALKDGWEKAAEAKPAPVAPVVVDADATPEAQARIRAEGRAARLARDPGLAERFAGLVAGGAAEEEAFRLAEEPARLALWQAAVGAGASGEGAARWLVQQALTEGREAGDLKFDGAALGRLVRMVEAGELPTPAARKVLGVMLAQGGAPEAVRASLGLDKVADDAALVGVVDAVLAAHPGEVARFQGGEVKLIGFFTGLVMRGAGGAARPDAVQRLLKERLASGG
jgi:glutaminyl-tRNA synthetase